MSDLSDLQAVPLYTHVDRVARGLAARGIGPDDAIPTAELFALDQWHYHGTDAIRDAGAFLGLGPTSRWPMLQPRLPSTRFDGWSPRSDGSAATRD